MNRVWLPLLVLALVAVVVGLRAWPEGGTATVPEAPLVLHALAIPEGASVRVDGTSGDRGVWDSAPKLVSQLEGPGATKVTLQAAYDDETLYFLVQWSDDDRSYGRYWRYMESGSWKRFLGEDSFSILWSPGSRNAAFREQGCALYCHSDGHRFGVTSGIADIWYWGAQSTNPLGETKDMILRGGPNQPLRPDAVQGGTGTIVNENQKFRGPAFVPRTVTQVRKTEVWLEKRRLTWQNAQALTPRIIEASPGILQVGWEVSYDILRAARGSRADVRGVGRFLKTPEGEGAGWVVELSRPRDTGNRDDLPILDPSIPYLFAIAVHDGTEGAAHGTSGVLELRLMPRE